MEKIRERIIEIRVPKVLMMSIIERKIEAQARWTTDVETSIKCYKLQDGNMIEGEE